MGTIQIDGSTPKLTIGNATAEDATILFDGNAQDFYIALDDSADDLLIGLGSTVGTTPAIAIDENLKVNIPVTTASTSASTGSLTTGGGAGIGADLYVGDDVYLITDSAILGFGADKDTTLTHTDGTGLTLNSTNKLCFNDASQFVQGSSNAILALGATDEIDLTATAVDLNGTLDVSGNSQFSGTITVGVDDTGKDVKFFGATASSHMLWDESADTLNLVASTLGVGTVGTKDLGVGIHIKTGDSGASAPTNGDELIIEGSTGSVGMTILSATDGEGKVNFGDSGDNDVGRINYNHDSNYMTLFTGGSERMRIDSGGRLFVQTGATFGDADAIAYINGPSSKNTLYISIGSNGYDGIRFYNASHSEVGSVQIDSTAVVYNTSSDYRLKENETSITDGIDRIKQLKPYRFNFKTDTDKTVDGFFAHEVSSIVPEAITGEKDAMHPEVLYTADDELPEGKNIGDVKEETKINPQGIDQAKLVPLLTSALQEAITKIETLEAKVAVLEG